MCSHTKGIIAPRAAMHTAPLNRVETLAHLLYAARAVRYNKVCALAQ
jgi:hypothetical protein